MHDKDSDLSKDVNERRIEAFSIGGFTDVRDLVGEHQAKVLQIFSQFCDGIVLCDELSNVVWVDSKFERVTGFGLQDLQHEGLHILLPPKYRDKHQRWVAGFHEDFRSMSNRGTLPIPCKDGSSFKVVIHIATFQGSIHGEPTIFKAALLQHQCEEADQDFISKRIANIGTLARQLGTPTIIGIFILLLGLQLGRVIGIFEGILRRMDLIEEVRD